MAAGLCFGVLMLAVGLGGEAYPSLRRVFDGIHAPANWAAQLWSNYLHLPPRGEAAFAVVPMAAVVLQWALLGLFVGVWGGFRRRRAAGT